jgi:hypothetical protein
MYAARGATKPVGTWVARRECMAPVLPPGQRSHPRVVRSWPCEHLVGQNRPKIRARILIAGG